MASRMSWKVAIGVLAAVIGKWASVGVGSGYCSIFRVSPLSSGPGRSEYELSEHTGKSLL